MRLQFTSLALAELEEIRTFLLGRSPQGAANVEARFKHVFEMISRQPLGYQQVEGRPGIRRAPLATYPYVIYYRLRASAVEILRVRHGAQRPLKD